MDSNFSINGFVNDSEITDFYECSNSESENRDVYCWT